MRRGPKWLACAVMLACVARVGSARASDEDDAREAMRRGVAAFGRGDAERALVEYEAAKRLVPQANAPYRYAAEALAALGRWPEAVTNLEGYLAKNPNVSDGDEVRERIAKIRAEHFPARAKIVADPPDAQVVVDGEAKGPPTTFELAAGAHRVEVRAPGRVATTQEVVLVGDRDVTLVFTLQVEPPPRVVMPVPVPVVPPPGTVTRTSPWRTAGWITLGASAATVLTTLIVDGAALGPAIADYEAAADRGDASARALREDATSLRTGVAVGYVTGGILAIAGVAMVLLAPPRSVTAAPPPSAGGLRVRPGLGSTGLVAAFSF